jgi:hypothetical protein
LSPSLFEPLTPGRDLPWDVEGIGIDSTGALYLSEEHLRWILKQSAPGKPLERLSIDWSPASRWFSKTDRNASFEGVAVGDRFLYVANERDTGRIFEIDRTLQGISSGSRPVEHVAHLNIENVCRIKGIAEFFFDRKGALWRGEKHTNDIVFVDGCIFGVGRTNRDFKLTMFAVCKRQSVKGIGRGECWKTKAVFFVDIEKNVVLKENPVFVVATVLEDMKCNQNKNDKNTTYHQPVNLERARFLM